MRNLRNVVLASTGVVAAIMVAAAPARAQTYGLDTQLYVQANGGTQQTTNFADTGFLQSTAPVALQFTSSAQGGASAFATAEASSFYGSLDVSGSGSANPVPGTGSTAVAGPYIGAAPDAYFRDQITVGSNTLAAGAPVSLTFVMNYTGAVTIQNESPGSIPSDASISNSFQVVDITNGDSSANFMITNGIGTFTDTRTVVVGVGDVLSIVGAVYGSGEADSGDAGGASAFSFTDPATVNITGITPGVDLVTASGHDYGLAGGVPEPATWAMLLMGFAGLGAVLRRRRAVATA